MQTELTHPIRIPYTQHLVDKVKNKLLPMTKNMYEPNEEIINEEQNKIREYFGTKNKSDCFAIGMMLIENLENKTSWTDFFPQTNKSNMLTDRIHNTYDREHDVSKTQKLQCICGQPIHADNSYFYHNSSVSPIHLIVGQDCAEKFQLATHDDILKLRKQKRDNRKAEEKRIKIEHETKCKFQYKFKCLINKFILHYNHCKIKILDRMRFNYVYCQMCNNKCSNTNIYYLCLPCKIIFDKNN